jgi:flavin-dependent dehydrogenase
MYDLIVIGGGPAGSSTAITAARNGNRVLLLERGRFPRHKVCGEFVSSESLNLLGELLHSSCSDLLREAVRIRQARIFVDDRIVQAPIEPAAASIARLDLDKALWDSAERAGVEAKQQVTVQKVSGARPFFVTTSVGDFEARAVVDASGRWSNLSVSPKANGNGGQKWIGLKAHFSESAPSPAVSLYFFDGGYCGVQPVTLNADSGQDRVNACAMVKADIACSLPEVFQLHPALRQRAAEWESVTDPVSVAPLRFEKRQPSLGDVLMVGDAAGFVDPFVGDGISLALRSGALASHCLLPFFAAKVMLQQAVRWYSAQYLRQFAPVFKSSSKIRRVLLLPRSLRAPMVYCLAYAPSVTKYLVKKTR